MECGLCNMHHCGRASHSTTGQHHALVWQRFTLHHRPASCIGVAEAHYPMRSQIILYVTTGMLGCSSRRLWHLAKTFLVT